MAPSRPQKRLSTPGPKSARHPRVVNETPTTPDRSPIKKRKGISLRHKQTLIDNLQLEITERARRLRAQYHMQAQGIRSRIEIRINRIPSALRRMKMGDLLNKCLEQEHAKTLASRPPPVPAKDVPVRAAPGRTAAESRKMQTGPRGQKRLSDELAGDKENEFEYAETTKKRVRAGTAASGSVRPAQVLSPTSSNSRLVNRERPASPAKGIARPGSPLKATGTARSAAATGILSSMVEKAKGARPAIQRKPTATPSHASTAPAGGASRTRKPVAAATGSRPGTRMGRRVSATSEASDGSNTTTVVRKTAAPRTATAASATKKVMSTFRKGTASADTKKTAATKTGTAGATATGGRVLRKRA